MKKKLKVKKSFDINRRTWLNGTWIAAGVAHESMLFSPDVRGMCCLGVYAEACGVSPRKMSGHGDYSDSEIWAPYRIPENSSLRKLMSPPANAEDEYCNTSKTHGSLVTINDNEEMSLEQREKKIQKTFKTVGVTVKFTGTYPKKVLAFVAQEKEKEKERKKAARLHHDTIIVGGRNSDFTG